MNPVWFVLIRYASILVVRCHDHLPPPHGPGCRWPQCSSHCGGRGSSQRRIRLDWGKVQYLGYHLGGGQVRPLVDKAAAFAACPRSEMKKEVRWFLGLASYYR